MQHQSLGGAGGGMPLSDLQRMQQTLQAYGRQPQQGQASLAGMGVPNSMQQQQQQFHSNPQFVAMAQQQGRGMKSSAVPTANTALAVMQQGNSVSQGHSSMSHGGGNHGNSNAMYGNWNSMQGNNMNCAGGGGVSSMDATTGSSARLMAMAGMGMGMNQGNATAAKQVGDASMQNMQALFEMQQQQQLQNQGMSMSNSSAALSGFNGQNMQAGNHQSLMGHNQDPNGVVPNNQQQLMLQRQLASIQKQMQSRQVSNSGSVGPSSQGLPQQSSSAINGMVQVGGQAQATSQAAMLQARQQHLLKQMQQQQSGGANVGMMNQLSNSMQQDPSGNSNSMMGMMQQMSGMMQQRRISGSSNSIMGNQAANSSSHMDTSTMGMAGSLNEQRLRIRQHNILRASSNSQSMGTDAQAASSSLQMNSGHHTNNPSLQGNLQGGHVGHNNAHMNSMQFPNAQQQVNSHIQNNQIDMNSGQFGRQSNSGMNDNSSHSQLSNGSGNANNNLMMPMGQQQQDAQKSFLDGSFAGGWQSNDDIPDRRRIILSILDVVRQMRPDSSKMSTKLPHMAKSLEEHLYRSAQTKEEYLNLSTLKTRLQAIAQGLELHRSTSTSDGVQQRMQMQQGPGGNQNFDSSNAHQNPAFPMGLGTVANSQTPISQQQNATWTDNNGNVQYALGTSSQVNSSHHGNVQLVGQTNIPMQQGMFRQGQMNSVQNNGDYGIDQSMNLQQQSAMWASSAQSAHGNDEGFLASTNMLQSGMTNLSNQNVVSQMDQPNNSLPQHMMSVLGQQSNAVDVSSGTQMQDSSSSWNNITSGVQGAPLSSNIVNNDYPNTPKYQDPAAAQKKKVILQQQQRLLLLRHASKCKAGPDCATKFCSQMITLWKHMKTCRDRHCKTSHCLSSRCVLNHYRICKSNGRTPTCEVCGPVMAKIKQQERDSGTNDPLTRDHEGTQGGSMDPSRQHDSSSQQLKLQTHFESLQELQRQQQQLIEQQSRLREQAQQIADPSTQQARQLKEQQALLSQLQQRCQEQQRLIHQELQSNAGSSVGNEFQGGGTHHLELSQFQDSGNSVPAAAASDSKAKPGKAVRSQNQAKKTAGKGRRSGKGKAFSVALAEGVAQSQSTETKKRAVNVVSEKERATKKPKESEKDPEPASPQKVVSKEDKNESEPADLHNTSLIPFMTREAISKHLDSLNKRIRLSSRTVTHKCLPLVQNLLEDQFGWVFQDAVDPVALGLPDYFDVVKNPMHLELVKKKLENAVYSEMEDVARDVRLVFENAILYNGESSEVGQLAQNMLKKFDKLYQDMIQDVENSQKKLESNGEACSLCGGQKRLFEPTILYCRGNCGMQRIKRQATYYTDRTKQNHWCDACYAMLEPDEVIVLDDNSEIRKGDLQEFKNDALPEEPWVNCDDCGSWVHQICSLFNGRKNKSHSKYTCPTCYVKNYNVADVARSEKFMKGAEDLPKCKMSISIESGLTEALEKSYVIRAAELNIPVEDVEKAEGLTVRVVSNVEKRHIIGEKMRERYSKRGCPTEFPVRTKCIALFQKIHGVDTFLFALYVYEYGHNAPAPNRRRVYISYLDSVQYFEPKCYRTTVYHTILVEYLRYVKNRGFHTAHIWSCPPTPGDDYIFYCHPSHQLTPREDMLRSWYQKMLERAKAQGIVIRTSTLYDEYFSEDSVDGVPVQREDPTCLPYFEGDYIPGEIENIIKMQEKRYAQEGESLTQPLGDEVMLRLRHNLGKMKENFIVVHLRNRRFAAAVERGEDVSEWMEDSDEEVVRSKRAKISGKDSSALLPEPAPDSRATSSTGDFTNLKSGDGLADCFTAQDSKSISNNASLPKPLATVSSMGEPNRQISTNKHALEEIKPVIRKHFSGIDRLDRLVPDTADEDEPVENEMFESRQLFLNYCQANHCQFDELRRAKHSTMMVLFQLHNPMAPKFLQQCGACYRDMIHGVRYHCNNCSNFDLCSDCYEPVTSGRWAQRDARFAHDSSHSFTPVDIEAVEEPKKSQEDKHKSLRVHIDLLEHAAMCPGSPECSLSNCERMKNLLQHVSSCDVKPKKDCKICTRLLALCSMHARMCTASVACSIPFCDRIRERNSRLRRQQELMDDRRRQAQNELYHTGSKS